MTLSDSYHIESATGRFRRGNNDGAPSPNGSDQSNDDTRGWRLPTHQNQSENVRKLDVQVLIRFAVVCFLFLQGLLSGLSLSALYEAVSSERATNASEARRYFFIGITLCLSGSLCMFDEEALSRVVDIVKGRNTPSGKKQSTIQIHMSLVLIYFVALIITLLASRVDVNVQMSNVAINGGTDEELKSLIDTWRRFAVPRSILCIAGWFVSCYHFVITRSNNAQRDE